VSTESSLLEGLSARLPEAVDCALTEGLLKFSARGELGHAPFSLAPCPLSSALNTLATSLTAPFNRLVHALARDPAFLRETLAPAAAVDDFTARLVELTRAGEASQPLFLAAIRSDYFPHRPPEGGTPLLRQVELNTISSSYAGLAARMNRVHRHLLRGSPWEARLLPNDPLPGLAEGFAQACLRYGHPQARVVMVVQPGEANVFDQRLLEFALTERGLVTRRCTLEEIAREGRLREGHLVVRGEIAAITYFRAAYGPEDFQSAAAFRARALIESSSTVAVPDLATQLAGSKKVQQVLADPAVLRRFLPEPAASAVQASFAALHALEQMLPTEQGPRPAWQVARERPGAFVLKPQREGGGHNDFDEALRDRLASMPEAERSAYVLMERIRPPAHPALLVRQGAATAVEAVSEIGRFGVYLAEGSRELLNRDVGYLVRTKSRETREGGVSAGFGFLDSLLEGPESG
jgi:glutathione synthase